MLIGIHPGVITAELFNAIDLVMAVEHVTRRHDVDKKVREELHQHIREIAPVMFGFGPNYKQRLQEKFEKKGGEEEEELP